MRTQAAGVAHEESAEALAVASRGSITCGGGGKTRGAATAQWLQGAR